MPTGLVVGSVTAPSGSTVSISGQTVRWTIADLAASGAGSTSSLTIPVSIETDAPVTNTATFTQTTPSSTGTTSGTSNSTPVTPQYANVTLSKSVANAKPNVGSSDMFTITAHNAGNADSGVVVVTDVVPAGLTIDTVTAPTGSVATVSGQTVTWTISDLAAQGAGATASLHVAVTVTTAAVVTNTATFTQTIPSSSGSTSGTSNPVVVTPQYADVTITKVASNATPYNGSKDTFTITVVNHGPAATAVTVVDPLPAGVTFVSATSPSGASTISVSGNTVTWRPGTLAASGRTSTATLHLTVKVERGDGSITNTATEIQTVPNCKGAASDGNAGPCVPVTTATASATIHPQPVANVSIKKTVSNPRPYDGSSDTYTVRVSNAGPDRAEGVVVTDPLPAGLSYVSASVSIGTVSERSVNGVPTITWVIGSLKVGEVETMTLVVVVHRSTGKIVNTATETQTTANPLGKTQSSSAAAVAVAAANVSVHKTVSNPKPEQGSRDSYLITATNAGPDPAQGVVVVDELPAGLTFVSASASAGSARVNGSTVTWTLGTLSAHGSATLTIVVVVTASTGKVTNTAKERQTTVNPAGVPVSSVTIHPTPRPTPPPAPPVPPAHTGEPWSGWLYWLLVWLVALAGLWTFQRGARRRVRGS